MVKQCGICLIQKPITDFTPIRSGKSHYSYCKKCASIRLKSYYATHPDKKALLAVKKREYAKFYREQHREKINSYYKQWYQKTNRYRPRKTVSE